MGQNKEQLKKLLLFIDNLSKQPGNEWFVEELKKLKISGNNYTENKIDEIYELCIEKIIKEQAEQFYKDFPINEIKKQLVLDFIRMEQFRRKDNFEDFCMAMYQQIECITNTIAKDKNLNEIAQKLLTYSAYTKDGVYSNRTDSEYVIAKLVFLNKPSEKYLQDISTHFAIDKIRLIMYFVCYKASLLNSEFNDFIEWGNLINYIYLYRNKNHRGDKNTDYEEDIFKLVDKNRAIYYLKFYSFLAFFMEGIFNGYPIDSGLLNYSRTLTTKKFPITIPPINQLIDVSKYEKKGRFK